MIYLDKTMSSTTCSDFFEKSGWYCRVIDVEGHPTTYISTPITLPGGKPLDFYLISHGDHIDFTDDGVTLFALRSIGYPLNDKRNWRGLENIASRHGFSLTETGAFEATFPESELEMWGAKILRLFCSIAAWEEDRFGEGDTDFSLTQELEMLLRTKDPQREIVRNVVVQLGKTEAHFDFLWGSTYVDALQPIANAVNARLRKALLINKEEERIDVLFVVDDRGKQHRVDEEIAVLGDLSPTIRLTDFERYYSPSVH